MRKKESLFSLIKSLSQAEKRYFKLTSGQEGANYLRLFDAINSQDEYNEVALKKKFEGEKFTDQFHVAKIYLQDIILKCLRNYTSKSSVNVQLIGLLNEIEILYDRELFDLCQAKVSKAKKIASKFEKFSLLLEIISWERKLILAKHNTIQLSVVLEMEQHAIDRMQELNRLWSLVNGIQSSISLPMAISDIKAIKAQPPRSLRAVVLHRHILFSSYLLNGKLAQAEDQLNLLIDKLEENPDYIQDDPASYATALGNKISLLLRLKRLDEVAMLIAKMRAIPSSYSLRSDNKFTVRLWIRLFNLELEFYRDKKDFKKGLVLMEEAELFLQRHHRVVPMDYRLMLYYQFAHFLFMNKSFSKALKCVGEIIGRNAGSVREDVQVYARILNLILHFELGNIIVIRYAVDNCRRFFKKIKKRGEVENTVLKFFAKLSLEPISEHQALFQNLYFKLFGVDRGTAKSELDDYFDLRGWIESKLKVRENIRPGLSA